MTHIEQIEIPLSKKKMLLTLLGSIAFVGFGAFFAMNPTMFTDHDPIVVFSAGVVSVLFFGVVAIFLFRKLSDKKPGLTINSRGITDNSSGASIGLVLWSDIEGIEMTSVANQKFLTITVENPHDYINKATNPVQRKGMQINHRSYGSPILISANSLQTNLNSLQKLLTVKMEEYKATSN